MSHALYFNLLSSVLRKFKQYAGSQEDYGVEVRGRSKKNK